MGAAKQFPDPNPADKRTAKEMAAGLRPPPVFEAIEAPRAADLLGLTQSLLKNAESLLAFVDARRDLGRRAAVETIAIEISVILTGDRLERVVDALERAVASGRPAQISLDGLRTLRRMEALLAEASSNMARFAQEGSMSLAGHEARAADEARRRAAVIEIEERRLALVKEQHRLAEESMGRDLDRRREEMGLVASLAGSAAPAALALPEPRGLTLRGEAAMAAAEPGAPDLFWPIVAIGALTFSAGLVVALVLRATPDPAPPRATHQSPRRK